MLGENFFLWFFLHKSNIMIISNTKCNTTEVKSTNQKGRVIYRWRFKLWNWSWMDLRLRVSWRGNRLWHGDAYWCGDQWRSWLNWYGSRLLTCWMTWIQRAGVADEMSRLINFALRAFVFLHSYLLWFFVAADGDSARNGASWFCLGPVVRGKGLWCLWCHC
jgi:hypothetical protein